MEYSASAHCAARHKPTLHLGTTSATIHGQSHEKENAQEPTCRLDFTAFSCLRTSCNFFLSIVLFADVLAKEQQKTAKTQNATSFIFSVSAAGTRSPKDAFRKIYWKCRQLCCLPFYTNPWGHRKTTCRELESCRNWRVWVMKFSFPLTVTTTWSESGVKTRVRGAYRYKCVNANWFECTRQETTGRRHFPFSFWISGAAAIPCHR